MDLKTEFQALLLVDEAHATGIIGPGGAGWVAALGLAGKCRYSDGDTQQGVRRERRIHLRFKDPDPTAGQPGTQLYLFDRPAALFCCSRIRRP